MIVKPVAGTTTSTNPSFYIQALLFGYTPIDGSIGDASTFDVEFRNASQTGLVVSTA